jgi:heterodisulfide reductase subunit A2
MRTLCQCLPRVTFATDFLFTCSTETQQTIIRLIKEQGLNRIAVAACSPKTHEPLFQDTLRKAGLNPYLFVSFIWLDRHELN